MKQKLQNVFIDNREKIRLYIGVALFLIILFSNFLRLHYSQDTYCLISSGYNDYARQFLYSGRPISAISLIIAKLLNFKIETYIICMSFIAILGLSLSICVLYYTIKRCLDLKNKRKSQLITILLSTITIINFCTIDLLEFAESGIMVLGVVLAVISACLWATDIKWKYVFIVITGLVSFLCHQSVYNIYVPLSLLIIVLKNKDSIAKTVKLGVGTLFIYGVNIIISTTITKTINKIFSISSRPTSLENIKYTFDTYKKYLGELVINTLDIGYKYYYIILISIITILFIISIIRNRKGKIMIFYYTVILVSAILLPILPLILIDPNSQYLESRMCISFGSSIGIMCILGLSTLDLEKSNKYIIEIVGIFVIFLFCMNCRYVVRSSSEMVATNLLDKNIVDSIIDEMYTYERENNTTIKNVGIVYDTNPEFYYHGETKYRCLNIKSLATDWAITPMINIYTNKNLTNVQVPEEINKQFFSGKNWTSYNSDQVVFVGDSMYICIY